MRDKLRAAEKSAFVINGPAAASSLGSLCSDILSKAANAALSTNTDRSRATKAAVCSDNCCNDTSGETGTFLVKFFRMWRRSCSSGAYF